MPSTTGRVWQPALTSPAASNENPGHSVLKKG